MNKTSNKVTIIIDESGTLPDPEGAVKEFVFDRHFHKVTDRERFDRLITDLLKIEVNIKHLDSIENTEINTADMVAGSVLWKYTGRDDKFYKVIKSRIIVEKMVNWKEAKRIFVDKIKKLT